MFQIIRRILVTFLMAATFLVSTAFSATTPVAHAKFYDSASHPNEVGSPVQGYRPLNSTSSPEARFKTQQDANVRGSEHKSRVQDEKNNRLADNAKNHLNSSVRNAEDSVRDKLNLDEPIYPGTKEFINDIKEGVSDVFDGTKDAARGTQNRIGNAVDNTKDAFGGVGEDIKDTINNSYDRVK